MKRSAGADAHLQPEVGEHMRARCTSLTRSGEPCQMPRLSDSDQCFTHDPRRAPERAAARRRGGLTAQGIAADGATSMPSHDAPRVRTAGDVLTLLERAIGDAFAGQQLARARTVAYLASVALKAIEQGSIEERIAALEARLAALDEARDRGDRNRGAGDLPLPSITPRGVLPAA